MSIYDQNGAIDRIRHRKIRLFWAVVAIFLPLPWLLKGCVQPVVQPYRSYESCFVLSIHDGDTMNVQCEGQKIRMRLYCIDAPELGQKPWGGSSRDYLREIAISPVRAVVMDRDRYGREIGELHSGALNLNLEMVRAGRAVVYDRYCHERTYKAAEEFAREKGIGVWSSAGDQIAPWSWRRR